MESQLKFKKIADSQNILFDEFFLEALEIEFIAFNYDAQGAALCRCDGEIRVMELDRVNKIIFGVTRSRLDDFITSIFDKNRHSKDLNRIGDKIAFRLDELNELEKYSVSNFAKKLYKQLLQETEKNVRYYEEVPVTGKKGGKKVQAKKGGPNLLHGNVSSRVFHNPGCAYFDDKNCTARFTERKEALSAGYKPCKLCDK